MLKSEFSPLRHSYTKFVNAVYKLYKNEDECDVAASYIEYSPESLDFHFQDILPTVQCTKKCAYF